MEDPVTGYLRQQTWRYCNNVIKYGVYNILTHNLQMQITNTEE